MDDDARLFELEASLDLLAHPDLDPLFWLPERRGMQSAWWGHVPFAHWLTQAVRPRLMVELGTHWGVSYAAFCEAVLRGQLNTRCFAVDTWRGDAQASFYGEEVYENLRSFHDDRYGAFSTLLRGTFDEALQHFSDGSVDLLHIDGLHTYEAVQHDFRGWLPKLSGRAVVLFHDIDVRRDDFGVWRLWGELCESFPHFHFHHAYGLGLLAVGCDVPSPITRLCALDATDAGAAIRRRVAALGARWTSDLHEHELRERLDRELTGRAADTQAAEAREHEVRQEFERESARRAAEAEAAQAREHELRQGLAGESARRAAEAEMARAREHELREGLAGESARRAAEAEMAQARENELREGLAGESARRAEAEAAHVRERALREQFEADLATPASEMREEELQRQLEAETAARRSAERFAASAAAEAASSRAELDDALRRASYQEAQLSTIQRQLVAIEQSTSWRATSSLRRMMEKVPPPVRLNLRRAARVTYWALTPHRSAARIQFLRDRLMARTGVRLPSLPMAKGGGALQGVVAAKAAVRHAPIVFISGFPNTPSETFRVIHPQEILEESVKTIRVPVAEIAEHRDVIRRAEILVLYRVAWSNTVAALVEEARAKNCLVVFDVDDYVFEPAIAKPEFVDGMRLLSDADRETYLDGVRAYRRSLEAADCCIVSTGFLAARIRELGKPAYVLPNAITPGMLARFDQALLSRHAAASPAAADGTVRIGYAAGTRTHQRDFAVVETVLAELLGRYPNVVLTILGWLDIYAYTALAPFADRIETRSAVAHEELPNELARFDINIAPLEIGNPFCEAKSELKFFDAAFLEIPTVASATEPFSAAIDDGESGFVARTQDEWRAALEALIEDPRLRIRVGKVARAKALRRFGPSRMREEVKQVFERVRLHHRPVIQPRGAGYDHFLYAINYPAIPLQPNSSKKISKSLDLHWVVPDFSIGWGGMTNIFRIVKHLEEFGHRSTVWVHNPPAHLGGPAAVSQHYRKLVTEHFYPVAAEFQPLPRNLDRIRGDAIIATDHFSAYPVRAVSNVVRRFYFLQDHEPEFHPIGYGSLFARATYDFGFDALSNGRWLHELAGDYGMWSMQWEQAAEPEYYFVDEAQPRKPGHIAFYSRLETPRRAVELGFLAFEILARDKIPFHVDMFGSNAHPRDVPFGYTCHGVLPPRGLGQLYREASIGMVFSATNYSIIPREMMACGLPVVELNSESSRRSFPDGAAVLAEPTPESVAAHLKSLLRDQRRRQHLAERGRRFAAGFSWEKSARDIEAALLFRLGRSESSGEKDQS